MLSDKTVKYKTVNIKKILRHNYMLHDSGPFL